MPVFTCKSCKGDTYVGGRINRRREVRCSQCRAINILYNDGNIELRKYHDGRSL